MSEVLHQDGRDLRARPGGQLAPLPPSQDPHHPHLHRQPHVRTLLSLCTMLGILSENTAPDLSTSLPPYSHP